MRLFGKMVYVMLDEIILHNVEVRLQEKSALNKVCRKRIICFYKLKFQDLLLLVNSMMIFFHQPVVLFCYGHGAVIKLKCICCLAKR